MDGYVASGRIGRVRPRLAVVGGHAERPTGVSAADDSAAVVVAGRTTLEQTAAIDTASAGRVIERWTALRARCSQLTFYLFDPNSWR